MSSSTRSRSSSCRVHRSRSLSETPYERRHRKYLEAKTKQNNKLAISRLSRERKSDFDAYHDRRHAAVRAATRKATREIRQRQLAEKRRKAEIEIEKNIPKQVRVRSRAMIRNFPVISTTPPPAVTRSPKTDLEMVKKSFQDESRAQVEKFFDSTSNSSSANNEDIVRSEVRKFLETTFTSPQKNSRENETPSTASTVPIASPTTNSIIPKPTVKQEQSFHVEEEGNASQKLEQHEAHLKTQDEQQQAEFVVKQLQNQNLPTFINPFQNLTPPSTADVITTQYKAMKTTALAMCNLRTMNNLMRRVHKRIQKEKAIIEHHRTVEVTKVLRRDGNDPTVRVLANKVKTIAHQSIPPAPTHVHRVIPEGCPLFDFLEVGRILNDGLALYKRILTDAPAMGNATMYEVYDFSE